MADHRIDLRSKFRRRLDGRHAFFIRFVKPCITVIEPINAQGTTQYMRKLASSGCSALVRCPHI